MVSNNQSCKCSKKNMAAYKQNCAFLSVAIYSLLLGLSFLTAVESRVTPKSSRRIEVIDSATDIEVREDSSAISSDYMGASAESVRRRPRRSARERDIIAFRKFLHTMRRKSRSGAGIDLSPEDMVKRDSAVTLDQGSTGSLIASKVKCGDCKLTKQWVPVSKPGCRTNFVLTPTCMGMCETWEIPDIHPPFIQTYHRVCRPTKIEYRQIRLRKCNPGVNNVYVMPIALNCSCMKCKSKNTACRPLL